MNPKARKSKLKPARINKDLGWNRKKVFTGSFPYRRRRLIKAALWLFILFGIGFVIFNSQLWKVSSVSCLPMPEPVAQTTTADWCRAVKEVVLGKNIFLINANSLEASLQDRFPPLNRLTLKRRWPAGLEVSFSSRVPLIAFNNENPESTSSGSPRSYFFVDETGLVFAKTAEVSGILKINYPGYSALKVGDRLEKGFLLFVIDLLKEFRRLGFNAEAAQWLEQSTFVVQLKGGPAVYLSADKDARTQARILQLVAEKYRIEGKVLQRVDLRFKDPVVEY